MKKLLLSLVVVPLLCFGEESLDSNGDGIPDLPSGEEKKDDGEKHEERENLPGKPGEGGAAETIALTGVETFDCVTNTLCGETIESTATNQNVILAKSGALLTVTNCTLNKSGDTSSEDASNFYAVNAVVAAKTNATIHIDHSALNSNAKGANCLFASGEGSTIYAYDCKITSTKDSSRGLDATYEGTVIASKLTINTSSEHCAAFATDRGNGYISATDSTLSTAGQGSPLIYSTGVIEANGVTGTATGAQIAGIEGLSTIRIKNSDLTGSAEKASESVPNGVMIYQSNSGDSTEGTATFEVSKSALKSTVSGGAMFYITNSKADIRVQDTEMTFDSTDNYLVLAAGNDGTHDWGTAGSNGAEVVFTAIDQALAGKVFVDAISSLDLYLTNSIYTGTIVTTNSSPDVNVFLSADSKWIVTADCTLKSLTAAPDAMIVDASGKEVSVVNSSGTQLDSGSGTSDFKITVSSYSSGDVAITNTITAFEIDRTAFDALYGTSQSEGGGSGSGSGSGGAQDHNNWTNYFKPFPPDNAIVKIKVDGASDYGVPDRDHKYCLDGYWDGNAETGVVVHLLYVTTEGYLFSDGCKSNTWDVTVTNNAQEVWPPEDVVAIKTQAKRGATYYLTLKEAIESVTGGGKGGAKITLNDNVTLAETLTVTNAITLDLNTNVVALGTVLSPAFLFTANATVSNGTIKSSLVATTEDCTLLRFTGSKATLSDVRITGDGYLLYVDDGARVTLTNNCALACNTAAAVYCSSNSTLAIAGDTSKGDGVVIAAPDGYYWEDGKLVSGTLSESISAGATTDSYGDAQSATNAAVRINANKATCITVPTGVEGSAKTTYLTKVAATVTSDNCVVIDLTPAAQEEEQAAIDEAVASETVVEALTSTDASEPATLTKTTPGLYYWIEGGTDVNAVTESGTGVLSTNGGSVELTKPTLDATKGRAFFKIAAGVAAPVSSNAD